ncbi:aminodeoxychorismate synthase component I [Alginatibacterium sediminis]|nr:aminodeoxychorismate synthase component I [Alginatibacterium sediminis]
MIETKVVPYSAKQLFAKISDKSWAMLFESGSNTHPNSRFDILLAQPIATVETFTHGNSVAINGERSHNQDDPFSLIEQLRTRLLDTQIVSELPFIGGSAGLWSYDLGRFLEPLPNTAIDELNTPLMGIGIYDWALISDQQTNESTLVVNSLNKHDAQQQMQGRLAWLTQLHQNTQQQTPAFKLEQKWQSNLSKQDYAMRFKKVQDYLLSGDCYQINLTQRFKAAYSGQPWAAYQALQIANKAPFGGFINLPQSSIVSVSPERFVKLRSRSIETKPIKGTIARSNDPLKDQQLKTELELSEKDRSENLMIVDLLRNDIGKVAQTGSVTVPELFTIESFPAVHHLVSTVTATLKQEYSAEDLLRALFPGGSITGAPKVRAMQIIEELEPHRRSAYCGAIGYISANGDMDTNITIRTLIFEDNNAYCWAGGGIVVDSQLDAEYQECFDKLSKILPALENINKCSTS